MASKMVSTDLIMPISITNRMMEKEEALEKENALRRDSLKSNYVNSGLESLFKA